MITIIMTELEILRIVLVGAEIGVDLFLIRAEGNMQNAGIRRHLLVRVVCGDRPQSSENIIALGSRKQSRDFGMSVCFGCRRCWLLLP
jgi:hypothetical protein